MLSPYCFLPLDKTAINEKFGSVHIIHNLWDEFEFCELTINQRQKNDSNYAKMLNRIRFGMPTDEDINKLEEKVIENPHNKTSNENAADFYINNYKRFDDHLYSMFPLTDDVDEFNEIVSNRLITNRIAVEAIDTPKSKVLKDTKSKEYLAMIEKISKLKTKDTAGLYTILQLGVNTRVMLRKNINIQDGLTNGAIGHIQKIIFSECRSEISSILVKFIDTGKEYEIRRISLDFQVRKNQYVTRSQFPISLAWALTIHKVQGLSLNAIMVDIGSSIFEDSMAYVALSRAKLFENVFLIKFDKYKLCCDETAVNEYNRLNGKKNGSKNLS